MSVAEEYVADRDIAQAGFAGLLDPEAIQYAFKQTTDATVTTLWTYTLETDETISVLAIVTAASANNAQRAGYTLVATAGNDSGTAAQVGTTTVLATHEDVAAWDATIDVNVGGGNIRVRVTGAAGVTINWRVMLFINKFIS